MSKTNQQQMFDYIVQWQQSGMSKKAWCEQHNVVYSSFNYWCRRFQSRQEQRNRVGEDGFVQLMVGDSQLHAPWCELLLGSGQKILFHQPVPVEFIRGLLR